MSSTSGKEQFMKQFDAIVEGVKQNKVKVSTRNIEISPLRMAGIHAHGQVQVVCHAYIWPDAGRLAYLHMVRCLTGIIPVALSLADWYTYSIKIFLHISVASYVCVCYCVHISSFRCYTTAL
jgi:hypothetical protein